MFVFWISSTCSCDVCVVQSSFKPIQLIPVRARSMLVWCSYKSKKLQILKSGLYIKSFTYERGEYERPQTCWRFVPCSALGVVLWLLLYQHSRWIAYPAATVQTGNPQGYETVPCLQKKKEEKTHLKPFFDVVFQMKDKFLNKKKHSSVNLNSDCLRGFGHLYSPGTLQSTGIPRRLEQQERRAARCSAPSHRRSQSTCWSRKPWGWGCHRKFSTRLRKKNKTPILLFCCDL